VNVLKYILVQKVGFLKYTGFLHGNNMTDVLRDPQIGERTRDMFPRYRVPTVTTPTESPIRVILSY